MSAAGNRSAGCRAAALVHTRAEGDTWGGCRGLTERSGIRGPRPVSVGEGNGGGLRTVISRPQTGNKEGERID